MKMRVEYVKRRPNQLEEGVLYICKECEVAFHLCPCGCGEEVVTPLGNEGWQLLEHEDGVVSLYPSIGNFSFKCQSHYFIIQNEVAFV